jgi:hypothetical protein
MSAKERIDGLENRIGSVEAALNLRPNPGPPKRLMIKSWEWVINNKGTSLILSLALCLVSVFGGALYKKHLDHIDSDFNSSVDGRIDTKLSSVKTKLTEMSDKLTSIDTTLHTLQPFIEDLIKRQMDRAGSLPLSQFRANLPAITHLISAARQQGVTVDPRLIGQVQQKLLTVQPRVLEFWPVSAELLSYRSFNVAPQTTQQLAATNLANCTDSLPKPMRITEVIDPHTIKFSRGLYENCRVTLDSAQDNERINLALLGTTPLITFKHCLVIYRGGAVNVVLAWNERPSEIHIEGHAPMSLSLSGNALEFENCLFVFSVQGVPPPTGQQLTESLLAQNTATLRLPRP